MPIGVRGFPLGSPFGAGKPGAGPAGPPAFDTDAINKILEPYGVSLPSQFSDAGPMQQAQEAQASGQGTSLAGKLFQNHPGIARGMDNALIAAALTKPSETAGEGISNVAQGLLGISPFRRQLAAQQAEIPLEFAKQIGTLQAQDAMLKMYSGMGDYYRQIGNSRTADAANRANTALMRFQMEGSQKPRIGVDPTSGKKVVQQYQIDPNDPDMRGSWVTDPTLDPVEFERQNERSAGGLPYQIIESQIGPRPDYTTQPQAAAKWGNDAGRLYGKLQAQSGIINKMFGNQEDPSATDQYNKWFTASNEEVQKQFYPSKFDSKTFISQQTDLNRKAGMPYTAARAQAQQAAVKEEQRQSQFNTDLAQRATEFHALPYDEQKKYGSVTSWLMQTQGYDPKSKSFMPKPSPQAQQNQAAGIKPGPSPIPLSGPGTTQAPAGVGGPSPIPVPGQGAAANDPMNILRFLPQQSQ